MLNGDGVRLCLKWRGKRFDPGYTSAAFFLLQLHVHSTKILLFIRHQLVPKIEIKYQN